MASVGTQTLGQLLAEFMERESLTLQAMAERAGLGVATIAALRSGSRGKRPQPHTVDKLAQALGRDPAEIWAVIDVDAGARERSLIDAFRCLDEHGKAEIERVMRKLVAG